MNAEEYKKAVIRIDHLSKKVADYENNQNEKMREFVKQFEIQEAKLVQERDGIKAKFLDYKKRLNHELKLKDVIIDRYIKYAEVLKVELAYAKNVIKNPATFQKVFEHMNFQKIELYKF